MNDRFRKLALEIDFKPTKSFDNTTITSAKLVEDNIFLLEFSTPEIIPFNEMQEFFIALNNNFEFKTRFNFKVLSQTIDEDELMKYITWITKDFLQKQHISKYLSSSKRVITGKKIEFFLLSELSSSRVSDEKKNIERILGRMGYEGIEIITQVDSSHSILEDEKSKNLSIAKTSFAERKNSGESQVKEEIKYKARGIQKFGICELEDSQASNVVVEGEIFNIKETATKSGYVITELSITDYKCAIYLKLFANKPDKIALNRSYEIGTKIIAQGEYKIDTYTKEYIITPRSVKVLNASSVSRKDDAKTKRVEFNVKTQMSAMDGIVTPKQIIKAAKNWGHTAIAINDTDSLQSFPEFYNETKNQKELKPIFGGTFSSISRFNRTIFNNKDTELAKDSYIVFDLETTSLSPIIGDIIEFGAVKVVDGKVIDKKQFFINTDSEISAFTTDLTGITKKDLANSKYEKDAILDIKEYIEDFTLVAHNANFDLSFLNEKLRKYGH
ncbi:MAG: PHP domain-containing protein, partial [Mycoplasmataceae bacterium]|nr:PHP domain-containing protein [Mycoplasmataceae bacterium]